MVERYFFEIAVYSYDSDTFYDKREKHVQKYLDDLVERSGGITREQSPDTFTFAERRLLDEYGTWQYNQVVGWIRLYVLGDQIRGEYWFVDAKQIRPNLTKKRYIWNGKAFELILFPNSSSVEIYQEVDAALQQLYQEEPFRGRFIDLTSFHNLGQFINWRKLVGFEQ